MQVLSAGPMEEKIGPESPAPRVTLRRWGRHQVPGQAPAASTTSRQVQAAWSRHSKFRVDGSEMERGGEEMLQMPLE